MGWIDDARLVPVVDVAEKLGMSPVRKGQAWSFPCPACGAERRHSKGRDMRGAAGVGPSNPYGWRCFQCDVTGGTIELVSYRVADGRYRDLPRELKNEVRSFFVSDYRDWALKASQTPLHATGKQTVVDLHAARPYPPQAEVQALWDACVPVTQDEECASYLTFRKVGDLRRLGWVARALPIGTATPEWAESWQAMRLRLIVPMYDFRGHLRSLTARTVVHRPDPARKSRPVCGYAKGGLLMVSRAARAMLAAGRAGKPVALRVLEGEVDLLRAVGMGIRCAIGVQSGSFTRDIASRIPSGSHIELATDDDPPGDKYAEDIRALLVDRVTYTRVRLEDDAV